MNETKICLLGGDTRQTALAWHLAQKGYETAVWGVPLPPGNAGNGDSLPAFRGVRCSDPESAVAGSRAVILPLPATTDGVRLHCPVMAEEPAALRRELRLTHLMEMLRGDVLLLAGRPGDVLRSMARDANIRLLDYYDSEAVQIKNAVPTAEGAIAIAMEQLPITIHSSRCTVLGCGRIGSRLCRMLKALGASVTAVARSDRDLSNAAVEGYTVRSIQDFLAEPGQPDVLFNTVPVPLITADTVGKLPAGTLLIELASVPGGFDEAALKLNRCNYIRAASLPGQVAPYTAGKILFESISGLLESEGIGI
ncbi:MAG: hypothetical protein E7662_04745 [Ruminococcaceae bacterium]|nr:hypothetical protein [Oscillospiraceae bacterium]